MQLWLVYRMLSLIFGFLFLFTWAYWNIKFYLSFVKLAFPCSRKNPEKTHPKRALTKKA